MSGQIGKVYRTDKSIRGSRQFYQKEYADCMAICREFGGVDLFVTFTMNPDCEELEMMLPPGEEWQDHADIVCRLFEDKLLEFTKDLVEREVLGPVKAWFYSIEHQKR